MYDENGRQFLMGIAIIQIHLVSNKQRMDIKVKMVSTRLPQDCVSFQLVIELCMADCFAISA